jgi:hypothetical protein
MKWMFLLAVTLMFGSVNYAQTKRISSKKTGVLTAEGAEFALTAAGDGTYYFTFHNSMGTSNDTSKIVFRNKKDAQGFINKIGKAFSAKDGTSFYVLYPNYKIRLLTEMNVVFMIVDEQGKAQSTFRFTKENYSEVNLL